MEIYFYYLTDFFNFFISSLSVLSILYSDKQIYSSIFYLFTSNLLSCLFVFKLYIKVGLIHCPYIFIDRNNTLFIYYILLMLVHGYNIYSQGNLTMFVGVVGLHYNEVPQLPQTMSKFLSLMDLHSGHYVWTMIIRRLSCCRYETEEEKDQSQVHIVVLLYLLILLVVAAYFISH